MLNKDKLLNHIRDNELKLKLIKTLNVVELVIDNYETRCTDFLNPYELREFLSIVKGVRQVNFHVSDEVDNSERKIVYVYPDYIQKEDVESSLSCILLKGNFKFRNVSHRDYLGSLLGLGIVREKIGDIFVHEDKAYIILMNNISDFVLYNMTKVANLTVKLEKVNTNEAIYCEPNYKEVSFTISTMRLDSVIAGLFNISRSVASGLIAGEKAAVDYEIVKNNSKNLAGGELISLRGFGRARFIGVEYTTKKDRLKVKGKLYL